MWRVTDAESPDCKEVTYGSIITHGPHNFCRPKCALINALRAGAHALTLESASTRSYRAGLPRDARRNRDQQKYHSLRRSAHCSLVSIRSRTRTHWSRRSDFTVHSAVFSIATKITTTTLFIRLRRSHQTAIHLRHRKGTAADDSSAKSWAFLLSHECEEHDQNTRYALWSLIICVICLRAL